MKKLLRFLKNSLITLVEVIVILAVVICIAAVVGYYYGPININKYFVW